MFVAKRGFAEFFFSLLADGQEGHSEQRLPHRIRGLAAQTAEGKADAEGDGRVRTRKVSACCYRLVFGFFLFFPRGYQETHVNSDFNGTFPLLFSL